MCWTAHTFSFSLSLYILPGFYFIIINLQRLDQKYCDSSCMGAQCTLSLWLLRINNRTYMIKIINLEVMNLKIIGKN